MSSADVAISMVAVVPTGTFVTKIRLFSTVMSVVWSMVSLTQVAVVLNTKETAPIWAVNLSSVVRRLIFIRQYRLLVNETAEDPFKLAKDWLLMPVEKVESLDASTVVVLDVLAGKLPVWVMEAATALSAKES